MQFFIQTIMLGFISIRRSIIKTSENISQSFTFKITENQVHSQESNTNNYATEQFGRFEPQENSFVKLGRYRRVSKTRINEKNSVRYIYANPSPPLKRSVSVLKKTARFRRTRSGIEFTSTSRYEETLLETFTKGRKINKDCKKSEIW